MNNNNDEQEVVPAKKIVSVNFYWYGTVDIEMPDDTKSVYEFCKDEIIYMNDADLKASLSEDGDDIVLTSILTDEHETLLWEGRG